MSEKRSNLPALEPFDLQDSAIREQIAKLGKYFETVKLVVAGHDGAIALSYGPPTPRVPCCVAWAYGYPHYDALMFLARHYGLPIHWDDELAEDLVSHCRQDVNRTIPRSRFRDVAMILINLRLT